jgi:hypothetical protein
MPNRSAEAADGDLPLPSLLLLDVAARTDEEATASKIIA